MQCVELSMMPTATTITSNYTSSDDILWKIVITKCTKYLRKSIKRESAQTNGLNNIQC
jgi:hypothetical protein